MTEENTGAELRQVLGAMIFCSRHPLSVGKIRRVLQEGAEDGGEAVQFAGVRESDLRQALAELDRECRERRLGFHLVEVAQGYTFQSDPASGPWVRRLLDENKPARLSRPALETLAIIAYRQPVMRSEMEAVRGVSVDHVLKMLLEMQLIRIVGRSELPGRPLLYGTTVTFLEHFGLRDTKELPGIEELSRRDRMARPGGEEVSTPVAEGAGPASAGAGCEPEEEPDPVPPASPG